MLGIDLHMHSHFSDGELSPQQLVAMAQQRNITMMALTDHDSIDGNVIAENYAQQAGIRFIDGVEISAVWSRPSTKKSHSVHIVALNMQNLAPMQQLLAQQQQLRGERARLICEKLQKIIVHDILPDVRALVDGHDDRITRSHIAKVLLDKKIVSRQQQAFDQYLKEGKRAYVPFMGVTMADAIDIIHQSNGFAVLAHPTKYDLSATNIRYMVELFAQNGGDAIELPPAQENPNTRKMIDDLIAKYQLKVSVGSDFHGSHMQWLSMGNVAKLKDGQVGIWHSFL
ncbi:MULTISPECIES: PHP domain-containing protein [unclassified Acinetobacter]|uniref:PHP domain-containing protein n=1 Tax=unclassified Acinetobacter TaxID=196816 RepID=UPI0035B88562